MDSSQDVDKGLEELRIATSEFGDDELPVALHMFLSRLREQLDMDVVFVSRFTAGQRTFVSVASSAAAENLLRPGMSDPIEQSWCHQVVQGRMPQFIRDATQMIKSGDAPFTPLPIGTHLSVPVVLDDGQVYGTLCSFALNVKDGVDEDELVRLKHVAKVIGSRVSASK